MTEKLPPKPPVPRPYEQDEPIPEPDVAPEDGPRGAQTMPGVTDTGITTPPTSGWGETVTREERRRDPPPGEDFED